MNKPIDGAWLSHVLVRLHLHTQSQFASACFLNQPSKATVISQDKTHNEATFCFENTFYYNWCYIQHDNKRTNLKKYVSLNEMASERIVFDSYYKATIAKTNDDL